MRAKSLELDNPYQRDFARNAKDFSTGWSSFDVLQMFPVAAPLTATSSVTYARRT
jgi:hypothetical protein